MKEAESTKGLLATRTLNDSITEPIKNNNQCSIQ